MIDANKSKRENKSFHHVITTDEAGIYDTFELVKNHLGNGEDAILSMIYVVSKKTDRPLFEKELSILEKRFSENLFICLLIIDLFDFDAIQENIEAIINSNTLPEIKFSVFGSEPFVKYVREVLRFLGVKKSLIVSKII
ncbi:MAG: hypothetical protein JXR61_05265 [Prolixibacteraceae bacterium]|nr:hypothetical protein [Prolixibacteraceae bacterium]